MVSFEQAAYHFNLRTFSSYQELLYFLERNCKYLEEVCHYLALSTAPIKKESGRYLDFSKTNIQVEGVDKPNEIYYFSVSEPIDAMTPSTPQKSIYIASSNRYSWSTETTIHKVEIKGGRIYYGICESTRIHTESIFNGRTQWLFKGSHGTGLILSHSRKWIQFLLLISLILQIQKSLGRVPRFEDSFV